MNPLERRLAGEIRRRGPLPFAEVTDAALYDPDHGFYSTGGSAGRRGDFLTSPEVGPLFGAVLARALDSWWRAMGEPDRFMVVEAGAGVGTLARSVLAATPSCGRALCYVAVERSAALRSRHPSGVVSLESLPSADDGPVVVVANELLDNLGFELWERTSDGGSAPSPPPAHSVPLVDSATIAGALTPETVAEWRWVCVDVAGDGADLRLVECLVEREPPTWLPDVPPGSRVPVQAAAARWLGEALTLAGDGGRVVVIDYTSDTAALAIRPQAEWLRTYRGHERGGRPLDGLGTQDVTVEVALDQLAAVRPPTTVQAQAEFLRSHGIDVLVHQGRRTWAERSHLGDLSALRARSRITEARALTDPDGLGAFTVSEWAG